MNIINIELDTAICVYDRHMENILREKTHKRLFTHLSEEMGDGIEEKVYFHVFDPVTVTIKMYFYNKRNT